MAWDSGRYVGSNTTDNQVDTSNVTSDADGSVLERLEFIQTSIGGAATQLSTQQSSSTTVEEDAYVQFSISIFDIDSGAIASGAIDITAISAVMQKSTGGAAFDASGITQPTFSKTTGSVYCAYKFLASEWAEGDMYKLVVSGVTATISATTVYVPDMVWSNLVTEISNLGTMVDTALTAIDLDHLVNTADGGSNVYPDSVVQDTIFAYLMSKGNPALATSYDNTTDSLEAISDKLSLGAGVCQFFSKSITSAANAGDVTIATVTAQPCLIESIVVHAVTASQTDLTSAAVSGGASKVVTFLSTAAAAVANLNAVDDQVAWTGAVRLTATKTIVMSLVGTGATAVNLNVTIKYRACTAGGYLA
jgi:hypothetical protein